MTPTLDKFAKHLAELQGSAPLLHYTVGPPPTVRISASHELVGDLKIYDDGDELTVEIGDKHHSHFSAYNYEQYPKPEQLVLAAQGAAEFVNDVMHDRVCITVEFKGARCIGSSHYYVADDEKHANIVRGISVDNSSGEMRSQRFLWSGPLE